jgi:hypothetical protein
MPDSIADGWGFVFMLEPLVAIYFDASALATQRANLDAARAPFIR